MTVGSMELEKCIFISTKQLMRGSQERENKHRSRGVR